MKNEQEKSDPSMWHLIKKGSPFVTTPTLSLAPGTRLGFVPPALPGT